MLLFTRWDLAAERRFLQQLCSSTRQGQFDDYRGTWAGEVASGADGSTMSVCYATTDR